MPRVVEVDGYRFPSDLYYTDRHLWVRGRECNVLEVGVDDLGQRLAGKVSVITLIEEGQNLDSGTVFGTMESAKWVERLRSPVSGTIIDVNTSLMVRPETVNEDPYGLGWMIRVKPTGDVGEELSRLVTGEEVEAWAAREVREKGKLVK